MFKWELKRKGRVIHFRILEQDTMFYSKEFLEDVNQYLTDNGSDVDLQSADCPELSYNTIFIRGSDTHRDKKWDSPGFWWDDDGVELAAIKKYRQALRLVDKYLVQCKFETNPILRKINSLENRFKAGNLRKVAETTTVINFPEYV